MADNQQPLDFEAPNTDFFCRACLTDKPAGESSPDSRYCQFCYYFLTGEAKQFTTGQAAQGGYLKPILGRLRGFLQGAAGA